MVNRWTEEEVQFLRDSASTVSSAEIAQHLGRSLDSVRAKASHENVKFKVRNVIAGSVNSGWTLKDISDLYGLSERTSMRKAAKNLGRSLNAIKKKSSKLGISFKEGRLNIPEVAEILGCHSDTVVRRRDKLKLNFRTMHTGGRSGTMRAPNGSDIVAIAKDMLNDPPTGHTWKTTAKELRKIIEDYEGWE